MKMLTKQTTQRVGSNEPSRSSSDFIQSWTMPEYVCDEILQYFKDNSEYHVKGGIAFEGTNTIRNDIKVSTDLPVSCNNNTRPFYDYRNLLQKYLDEYVSVYPDVNNLHRFNITEDYNIQHYKKGEGFKKDHCERDGQFSKNVKRCLVFMTYLNDVDDGGTIFKYQNRTVKAQKGKTLIWPADWTHTHRSQISETQEKTIVTGWFSYLW